MNKNYETVCDILDDIHKILEKEGAHLKEVSSLLELIRAKVSRMEEHLAQRRDLLIEEGYSRCPVCNMFGKTKRIDAGLYQRTCCNLFE